MTSSTTMENRATSLDLQHRQRYRDVVNGEESCTAMGDQCEHLNTSSAPMTTGNTTAGDRPQMHAHHLHRHQHHHQQPVMSTKAQSYSIDNLLRPAREIVDSVSSVGSVVVDQASTTTTMTIQSGEVDATGYSTPGFSVTDGTATSQRPPSENDSSALERGMLINSY